MTEENKRSLAEDLARPTGTERQAEVMVQQILATQHQAANSQVMQDLSITSQDGADNAALRDDTAQRYFAKSPAVQDEARIVFKKVKKRMARETLQGAS